MSKNEQKNPGDISSNTSAYAKFVGVAFQMLAIIGLFTFVGYKIDENAGHATKWVTAAMSLVGVFIAIFIVIRSIKG
jgi:uncharacterized membrane protein